MPLPNDFKHKSFPMHEVMPAHWNDVRFNFLPQYIDRRMYMHDNYMHMYDFPHDFAHTMGHMDEDHDWETPDPYSTNHFKKKRSGPMALIGGIIAVGLLILYPTCGLKMP